MGEEDGSLSRRSFSSVGTMVKRELAGRELLQGVQIAQTQRRFRLQIDLGLKWNEFFQDFRGELVRSFQRLIGI